MDERRRWASLDCAGLGLLAGALEALVHAATGAAPLSVPDRAVVGAVAMVGDAVLALVLGAALGLLLLALPTGDAAARIARGLAGTAVLLSGVYLWDAARTLASEGRLAAAAGFAVLPVGVGAVVFFNARFWLVRGAPVLGFTTGLAAVGLAASLVLPAQWVGMAGPALRDPGGGPAGPSVVLVTVRGVRADAALPAWDALADGGIRFTTAVTPATEVRPAAAAVLTGVHPLRVRMLDDRAVLARGWRTVPEELADAGLATAAFVSDATVGTASGLAQGFAVFDDRHRPAWTRAKLAALAVGAPGRRSPSDTVAAFETWLAGHADRSFLAWIDADGDADAVVARVRAALEAHGALSRTTLIATGLHGELAGAHGGEGHRTLYDEVVRVPLVVRTPDRPLVPIVDAQVRLMDVAPTLLASVRRSPMDESEGVELLGYGSGLRQATMWTAIVGRDLDGEPLVGLRNNGVKYVRHPDGREELYDAASDPGEAVDLAASQAATLEQARSLLAPDVTAFELLRGAR